MLFRFDSNWNLNFSYSDLVASLSSAMIGWPAFTAVPGSTNTSLMEALMGLVICSSNSGMISPEAVSVFSIVPSSATEVVISELLSGILVDAGQVGGFTINFGTANEEAAHFIEEVSQIVDHKMNEEFSKMPELPVIPVRFS